MVVSCPKQAKGCHQRIKAFLGFTGGLSSSFRLQVWRSFRMYLPFTLQPSGVGRGGLCLGGPRPVVENIGKMDMQFMNKV